MRRPPMVDLAQRLELDLMAIKEMQRLRRKYGPGPLMIRNPLKPANFIAFPLEPDQVHRVLAQTPEPFSAVASLKKGALSHFEPKVSLISEGRERDVRVAFNREVLDSHRAAHRLAQNFMRVVDQEAQQILDKVAHAWVLDWNIFQEHWFRLVRRVVFGDSAAQDYEIYDMVNRLRRRGNWSFLAPTNEALRDRYHRRVTGYLQNPEPGSLAELVAVHGEDPVGPDGVRIHPEQQIPQWMFAFDPAGIATVRGLALLTAFPEGMERARSEARQFDEGGDGARMRTPYLRAAILESLRLWPTTPLLLRESTEETQWPAGRMPANTTINIFANFIHRDDENLPYAHDFAPEVWLKDGPVESMMAISEADWPFVPFSAGSGVCPARHLVLMLTGNMLGRLIEERDYGLERPEQMFTNGGITGTLNHFALRFTPRPMG